MLIQMPRLTGDGNHRPERVTIHAMAEYLDFEPFDQHAFDFLTDRKLSAHYLITPSGDTLKCLEDEQIGRHAGRGLNTHNIGIEILVPGLHTYATFAQRIKDNDWCGGAQWGETVDLVRRLRKEYRMEDIFRVVVRGETSRKDITEPWLVRHSDIAPGRKIDPGKGFPWQAFRKEVYDL